MRFFLLNSLVFFAFVANAFVPPPPLKGEISYKSSGKEILSLNCKWEFYWNRLLTSTDVDTVGESLPDALLIPGSWSDVKLHGKSISSKGFATYRLTITDAGTAPLMLDVYSVQTACRVFVNGKLALEVGKVGTTKETTEPMNRDAQVYVTPENGRIELIVQVANFHHRKGGFVHPFEIGTPEAILKQRNLYYYLDFIESTALAIIGLFLFAMFIFRRKDLSILYFSLFCLTLAFRPVTSVNYFLATLLPGINWSILLKIEYLSAMLPCLFMLLFIREFFPKQLPKLFVKILSVILAIKIAVVLFCPPAIFSYTILPFLGVVTIGVIVFAITVIRAIVAKVEGANYAGIGLVVLFVSLLLKVFVYTGTLPPVHVLITVLDIGFIFMMSLILGSRFSLQFTKVETLQQQTEQQSHQIEIEKLVVEEKNKEILDSIHYSKRIQNALLPSEKYIERNLNRLNKK
jgi:hypothetical protein